LQDFSSWLQAIVKAEMMAKHCQIAISNPSSNANKHGQKHGRQPKSKAKHPPTINSINQKPVPSLPKTKQQDANGTKHSCVFYVKRITVSLSVSNSSRFHWKR
jgi:hypothetical protein